MRKLPGVLIGVVVLAAAGFALASIASGASLVDVLTGTTDTTATTTSSTTTTTSSGRLVTVCHLTGSRKHPAVTITVAQSAVAAVLKGGGHLGPCTGSETPRTHVNGSANGLAQGKGKSAEPTTTAPATTTTATTTSAEPGESDAHGAGHGSNGSGHGKGK